jgi:hypothetical protein
VRFIISGSKRAITGPTVYVSRNGCLTYTAANVAVIRGESEAARELEYWQRNYTAHNWQIERLPRGPVSTAILRAQPIAA